MILDVLELAEKGRKGEVEQIPLVDLPGSPNISRLGEYTNIGKHRYILVGGASGSGKSSYIDSEFVLKPFVNYVKYGGYTPRWIYRSMERSLTFKKAKWLSWIIFNDRGLVYDVPTIFGWGNKQRDLTKDDLDLFASYEDWFNELFKYIDVIQGTATPQEIFDYAMKVAKERGTVIYTEGSDFVVNDKKYPLNGHFDIVNGTKKRYIKGSLGKVYEGDKKYIPNNPNEIVIHIADHLGKLDQQGRGEMAVINEHGGYMGDWLRDVFGWCVIDVMQFNRSIEDTYRQIKTELSVRESDFRMSSVPYHNADLVMGLLNPKKYNKTKHNGYDMEKCMGTSGENRFRAVDVIKNTWGIDDFTLGLGFFGEFGMTYELPKEMTDGDYEDLINFNIKHYGSLSEIRKKSGQEPSFGATQQCAIS